MSHGTKALFLLLGVYGLALLCFGLFALDMSVDRAPELSSSQASQILKSTEDFRKRGSDPIVSLMHKRLDGSTTGCSATFSFISKKDKLQVKNATAEFRFFNSEWHLAAFWWGKPPSAESYVRIDDDGTEQYRKIAPLLHGMRVIRGQ